MNCYVSQKCEWLRKVPFPNLLVLLEFHYEPPLITCSLEAENMNLKFRPKQIPSEKKCRNSLRQEIHLYSIYLLCGYSLLQQCSACHSLRPLVWGMELHKSCYLYSLWVPWMAVFQLQLGGSTGNLSQTFSHSVQVHNPNHTYSVRAIHPVNAHPDWKLPTCLAPK